MSGYGNDQGNRTRRTIPRRRVVVWMTRKGFLRLAAIAGLIAIVSYLLYAEIPTTETGGTYLSTPLAGKVIALDAGHGGVDGGAVSRDGVIEKDINMAIVLYLRDYLQQAGALVILTREGDHDLASPDQKGYAKRKTEDLKKRAETIQSKKADLTVTIHMNSVPSAKWSGAQTFYYAGNPDSSRLATLIQNEIRETLANTSRVALEKDDVYLLKTLPMPTALVEVGFLSHPEEAKLLAGEEYQKKVAAALYRGILRYGAGEGKAKSDAPQAPSAQ
ncbi:N-acetylmuramoyl-L-alanine amidase CwlD [Cohnella nanjingensis]|uniref:N-acetylmuramoyl-L-alanine amidase CwlD n=1 Tax=Cohnella nanjingensis TaxID=1387779 RepID=A0A7X0RZC1_9BACL|nr:N-acetylmuramoyl-L-alanine amidase CwlD [Cohnella nanjingensis]MBB6675090.1 N-acetylmuramoyl-L-alanine amidase CwlD [Cohnella nanjingensis]